MKHTLEPWIAVHDHDKHYIEPVEETPHGDYIALSAKHAANMRA